MPSDLPKKHPAEAWPANHVLPSGEGRGSYRAKQAPGTKQPVGVGSVLLPERRTAGS